VKPNSGQGAQQRRLWESLVVNPAPSVKVAMNEALRRSPKSREQVVDDMNRLAVAAGLAHKTEQIITPASLDKLVAPGDPSRRIGAEVLYLFCLAVEDNGPLRVYSQAFPGERVVTAEDFELLEWARAERSARQAKKEARLRALKAGVE
jgi:hypothetical protein